MFNVWNKLISACFFARREQMRELKDSVPANPFSGRAIRDWQFRIESHGGDGLSACTNCSCQPFRPFIAVWCRLAGNFFLRSAHSLTRQPRGGDQGFGGSDLLSSRRPPVSPACRSPRCLERVFSAVAPNCPVASVLLFNCRTIVPISVKGHARLAPSSVTHPTKNTERTERLGTDDISW